MVLFTPFTRYRYFYLPHIKHFYMGMFRSTQLYLTTHLSWISNPPTTVFWNFYFLFQVPFKAKMMKCRILLSIVFAQEMKMWTGYYLFRGSSKRENKKVNFEWKPKNRISDEWLLAKGLRDMTHAVLFLINLEHIILNV